MSIVYEGKEEQVTNEPTISFQMVDWPHINESNRSNWTSTLKIELEFKKKIYLWVRKIYNIYLM